MNDQLFYFNPSPTLRQRIEEIGDLLLSARPTMQRYFATKIISTFARVCRRLQHASQLPADEYGELAADVERWSETFRELASMAATERVGFSELDQLRETLEDICAIAREVQLETMPAEASAKRRLYEPDFRTTR